LIGDPTNPSTLTEAENTFQVVDKLNFIDYYIEEIVTKQPESFIGATYGYYLNDFSDNATFRFLLLDANKVKLNEVLSSFIPTFPNPITGV
jgi:hypothetical protein